MFYEIIMENLNDFTKQIIDNFVLVALLYKDLAFYHYSFLKHKNIPW